MARNRLTLLALTQRVLSAMNHGSVSSIDGTEESIQIAEEARNTYYDLLDREDWPFLMKLRNLEAVSDTTRPNFLKIPEEVVRIDDIRYESTLSTDTNRSYRQIKFMDPPEFLDLVHHRNSTSSDVTVVESFDGVDLFIINDEPPQYWTTFDDEYVVFDAYDSGVDTTLQSSKSSVRVKEIPTWTHSDTFIPDLPDHVFSTYLAELTAVCFTYFKQGTSIKDEQRAARGIARLRKDARKHNEIDRRAKYGRSSPRTVRSLDGSKGSIRAAL